MVALPDIKRSDRLKLEWNVFVGDFNSKKIKTFNVFDHGRFMDDVKKALKLYDNKKLFAEEIRKSLVYFYWAKCEWEIVLTSWVPHINKEEFDRLKYENEKFYQDHGHYPYSMYINPEVAEKVDVYSQIMMNFEHFVDYIWSHKKNKGELQRKEV